MWYTRQRSWRQNRRGRLSKTQWPLELPLLGSNQDSPDPESGVLPITPRGTGTTDCAASPFGPSTPKLRGEWCVVADGARPRSAEADQAPARTTHHVPRTGSHGAEGARTPDLLGAIQALSQLSYSPVGRLNLETQPPSSNPSKLIPLATPPKAWYVVPDGPNRRHGESRHVPRTTHHAFSM